MSTTKCTPLAVAAVSCLAISLAGCVENPNAPNQAATPSASVDAEQHGGRHIVLMKAGVVGIEAVGANVVGLGAKVERSHSEIGALVVSGLSEDAARRLAARSEVEAVVRDRAVQWLPPGERRLRTLRLPDVRPESDQRDAAFFRRFQWNLKYFTTRAAPAWLVSNQGRGTLVCILDTGVDPRHIDLRGKLNFGVSASFVAGEAAIRDYYFHGTAMASIVTTNGLGIASVAPDARVCSIKVLNRTGTGSFADIAAGMLYAGLVGADVANMSLGTLEPLPRNNPDVRALTAFLQRAINFSTRRGVLFVAAAGGASANLNDPDVIQLPAMLDNVISVGATGPIHQRNFDRLASYTNFGRRGVDVFAPGGDFVEPRAVIEDLIISACSPSFPDPAFGCRDRVTYVLSGGTSQAAAHVSGEAAVIESELPGDQSPAELTACILRSADPLPRPWLTANGRINVLRGQRCGAAKGSTVVASH